MHNKLINNYFLCHFEVPYLLFLFSFLFSIRFSNLFSLLKETSIRWKMHFLYQTILAVATVSSSVLCDISQGGFEEK